MTNVPTYSLAERDRRWEIARTVMDEEDVDALLVYGEHEWAGPAPFAFDVYFTNARPGALVVFPRDGEPVALVDMPSHLGDDIEARARGEDLWIEPRNVRLGKHVLSLAEVLRANGLTRASVGVIGLDPYLPFHVNPIMPHALWAGTVAEFPQITFKSVWSSFLLRIMTQSPEELAVIEYAARAGRAMSAELAAAVRPGATETEVYAAAVKSGLDHGIAAAEVLLSSGAETISCGPPVWGYRPQPGRVIGEGCTVQAIVLSPYGMRLSKHALTVTLGEVHPDVDRAAEAARASYDAGLAAIKPGVTFGEVVSAMSEPITAAGGWPVHPVIHGMNPFSAVSGYGAGLSTLPEARPYTMAARLPTLGHDLVLQPGMTLSVSPSCAFARRMAQTGGTVLVTQDTPLELARR